MTGRKKTHRWIVVTHLLLLASVVAWTQTKSVNPVQARKKTPEVYYFKASGTRSAMKQPASGAPSIPPALTRSERINIVALARKAGNIRARSLENDPRASIVLTPAAPVSGLNYFNIYNGKILSIENLNRTIDTWATISNKSDSSFWFSFKVNPGKTYLADFKVFPLGRWIISGPGIEAEINNDDSHLLLAFTVDITPEGGRQWMRLRFPDSAEAYFYRCELTQID